MSLTLFLIVSGVLWLIVGVFWMLPQKMAIRKRVGQVSNAHLIEMATAGDLEIRKFRRRTWWYIGLGLLIFIPLRLLAPRQ